MPGGISRCAGLITLAGYDFLNNVFIDSRLCDCAFQGRDA
jgi:hypothetical protein